VKLSDLGLRLFHCELVNQDYLWFSSFEISKTSYTGELLHNYALSYSLSRFERAQSTSRTPLYEQDLDAMPHYATPGSAQRVNRIRLTLNAMDDRTLRTDTKPGSINSPDLGWRVVIEPWTEPFNSFHCYVFSEAERLPGVIRLGKKGCALRVATEWLADAELKFFDVPIAPSHPVNPLDVGGQLVEYRVVSMPPHLLLTETQIADDWFVVSSSHVVHVPSRFTSRIHSS